MNDHARNAAGSMESLAGALDGDLVRPDDAAYDEARSVWNAMIDRRPAAIARCTSRADVVEAVRFAAQAGLPIAVRGGGHNAGGSGTCDGGLVVDLGRMRGVRIDATNRVAWVQGGATWRELDREAQLFGLATPGGVVSATGVGGLTLAGGFGWLRGKFGLSVDNVLAVEMVTADGSCVRASAEENPELYWAVRGGGGNFGVVTAFEYRLHEIGPEVMFLAAVYRAKDAARVIKAWRDFMASAPDEIAGSYVEFSTLPEDPELPREIWGEKVATLAGVWAGPAEEGESAVAPLRALAEPLIDFSGRMPYCEVQSMFDALFPKGELRAYFKSMYLAELTDAIVDELTPRAIDRPSPDSLCSLWCMGGATSRPGADDTAFGARDAAYMFSVDAIWRDAGDDEVNLGWARSFWSDARRHSNGRAYLNFAGLGEEGEALIRKSYGERNHARLREIKRRFDPHNLFRFNLNIAP